MRTLSALALIVTLVATPARADEPIKRADELFVALFGTALVKADDRHNPQLDRSYGVEGRFGYHAEHHWGYEMRVFYSKLHPKQPWINDGNRSGIGGDAVYRFGSLLGVRPYLLAGVGVAYSDKLPGADWVAPYANVGFGLSTVSLVELWERGLRVRGEVRWAYEDYRDDYTDHGVFDASNYVDVHALVGVEFALTRTVREPPPPPPEVVPPVDDTDGDGVADAKDECPGTGPGTLVDERGCPK